MKYVVKVLCGLVLFVFQAFGQENPLSKFKLAVYGTPEYTDVTYRQKKDELVSQQFLESYNRRTTSHYGFTAGVSGIYELNKNVELAAGLAFSHWGQKFDDEVGFPGFPNYISTLYNYYLEIPVKASFLVGKKKLRFITTGEVAFALRTFYREIFSEEFATFYQFPNNETHTYKSPNPGIRIGLSAGIDYQFAPSLSLRVEPQFKHLWIVSKSSSLNSNTLVLGVNCTLVKSF